MVVVAVVAVVEDDVVEESGEREVPCGRRPPVNCATAHAWTGASQFAN